MKTLKQLHEIKNVSKLRSKLIKIDHTLNEQRHRNLVLEAFDQEKMKLAGDLVKKLGSINFGGMKTLSNARNLAIKDCKASLSGPGGMQKIINLFKSKESNPLADAVALCDALLNFFELFPKLIQSLDANNEEISTSGGSIGKKDKTLGSLFGDEEDNEIDAFVKAVKNKDPKALQLQKVITIGFKPKGTMSIIGNNYFTKYLNGKTGMQSLTKEMLNMKVTELSAIAESVTSALKNAETVGQSIAGATENTTKSSDSTSTEPSKSSDLTKSSEETTASTKSPETKNNVDLVKTSLEKITDDLAKNGINKKSALNVLKILSKHDKLK